MLTPKRVTQDLDDLQKVKGLMLSAFPKDELTPFKDLFKKTGQEGYDFFAFYGQDDNFKGLAYVTTKDDIAYLFWLAVNEEERGNGIGSEILSELKKIYDGYRIILDIERINENANNNDQRIRRKKFYSRNDFVSSGLKYDLYNVEYEILINNKSINRDEFEDIYSYILDTRLNLEFLD